jgi:hypothetical protein
MLCVVCEGCKMYVISDIVIIVEFPCCRALYLCTEALREASDQNGN